jgi:mono/diheme cytochrome c family protein
MALMALALPVLPDKKAKFQDLVSKLNAGPMKAALDASRKAAGVHERTFLQETPQGALVVVTLETSDGSDPMAAFGKTMSDPALKEFAAWVADVHGVDPKGPGPSAPKLIYDSNA